MGFRLIANETIPSTVYRRLLLHERKVIVVRMHGACLVPSLTMSTGSLLAAVAIGPLVDGNTGLTLAIWLLAGALIVQSWVAVASWLNRYLVVSSQRIMLTEAGFRRSGLPLSLPLSHISDIRLIRSTGGRLHGYGTLVCDSAGITIRYVPYPEQLYLEITGLLFPDKSVGD